MRAAKIEKETNYLEYSERLKKVDLTTLEQRRKRVDLYKYIKRLNVWKK